MIYLSPKQHITVIVSHIRLYDYYGRAICKHAGDVGAMTNTIWTFPSNDIDAE